MYQFKPGDLRVGYNDFKNLREIVGDILSETDKKWLEHWDEWDMTIVTNDQDRPIQRLAHYWGYMDGLKDSISKES